ncbi:MAG: ABC transporter substrate-binding protein [Anaerolineae bacterium]
MSEYLKLLIWPDYVDPGTLVGFEQESGCEILVEIVPSAVELVERMRADADPPDVLVPTQYAVMELHAEGRLATLDHGELPNLEHLEPRFRWGRTHDPDSRVSVVKDWGTTGFMFRTDKVTETPRSWSDFWRLAEKYSGHVTVLDSPSEVIGAALKMRGYSYNASDPQQLAEARTDLLRLKPHLLAFETNYRPLIAGGEAWLSLGWNGDAASLTAQGVPVYYVIPREGSQIWEDDWAIAAASENLTTAHRFINFLLRPDIAAQEARYTRYATANRSAYAVLDSKLRNDPAVYPPQEIIEKLEPGMPLDEATQELRTRIWAEVRA